MKDLNHYSEYMHKSCGAPKRQSKMRFDDMVGSPIVEHVGTLVAAILEGNYHELDMFICMDGGYGVGKTRCAVHMMQAAMISWHDTGNGQREDRPYFLRGPDLMRHRYEPFDEYDEVHHLVFDSGFLVLDDPFNTSQDVGKGINFVEEVVEYRHEQMLSTVVTMNSEIEDIGEKSPRLASFLRMFKTIPFGTKEDFRTPSGDEFSRSVKIGGGR